MGSTGLCSGLSIELIPLVLQHLPKLTSVLPMFSKEMARDFFYIIQKCLPRGIPYEMIRNIKLCNCQKM